MQIRQKYQIRYKIPMGNCTAANQRPTIFQQKTKYNTVPPQTEVLKEKPLPRLRFNMQLSNIKVRNCEHPEIDVKFKIADIDQYQCPLKKKDQYNKVHWKVNHTISSIMTEYQIMLKFLIIQVYSSNNYLIGSLNVNLYLIWTGPSVLDLKLDSNHSKKCRFCFNYKISQEIHFKIQTLSTTLIRNQPSFPQDGYTFWIQPIIGQQLEPSNHTYLLKIKDNPNTSRQNDQLQTYTTTADNIIWQNQKAKDLKFPVIQQHLYSHQLRKSTLQITFFKLIKGTQNSPKFQVQSQCFISFPRLMTTDYQLWKDNKTLIIYQSFLTILTQKTWNQQKEVGKAILSLKIIMQTHQKQMLTYIRTEKGLQLSKPLFFNDKVRQNEDIITLKKILDKMQASIIQLQHSYDQRESSVLRQIILNIVGQLTQLQQLISRTTRESLITYEYANQLQLIHAQKVIIDVALKVLGYIRQEIHSDIQQKCWSILLNILKRSQLSLSNIGFSKQRKKKIQAKNIDQTIQQKIEVGLQYQKLLHQLLKMTLNALIFKGEEAQSNFAETFCAYAYLRVPVFRENLLSIISKKDDPQLIQWRYIQQKDDKEQMSTQSEFFQEYDGLINWQAHFHQCFAHVSKFKANELKIQAILQKQSRWKQRISKRKGIFYTFIQNLIKEIQFIFPTTSNIQWQYILGYYKILYAFLSEVKLIKITSINQRFKRCCLKLLTNQKLLNVFIILLLKKTNSLDSQSTLITLCLISDFFQQLRKGQRDIPSNFDYKFFLKGIKSVLQSQFQYNISQIIVLIYTNFDFFPQTFSLELLLHLLSKYFFRFFLHWSYHLRCNFHTFISVRANKSIQSIQKKQNKDIQKSKQSSYLYFLEVFITQKCEHLFKILKQQSSRLQQQNKNQIIYQNTYHRRMKVKLIHGSKYKSQNQKNVNKQYQTLPVMRTQSQGTKSNLLIPRNKIYFQEEQLRQISIKLSEILYIKQVLAQYKVIVENIEKKRMSDPDYQPQLKLKKIIDAKEYGPTKVQDW